MSKQNVLVISYSKNAQIFKSCGFSVQVVSSLDEARENLKKISNSKEFCLVFLIGKLGVELKREIEELNINPEFNLIWLPDETLGPGFGRELIEEKIKKAVGFKINF